MFQSFGRACAWRLVVAGGKAWQADDEIVAGVEERLGLVADLLAGLGESGRSTARGGAQRDATVGVVVVFVLDEDGC